MGKRTVIKRKLMKTAYSILPDKHSSWVHIWLTQIWVNFGSWWCTGRPGVLRFMRSQRIRHGWVTELTPYTNINSKWIEDLSVRPETIKLLEGNIGRMLFDINHSKILYDSPPRVIEVKPKINKWDLFKLKCFCTTKETISKVKRQPWEWEKIIVNETDKVLISKI